MSQPHLARLVRNQDSELGQDCSALAGSDRDEGTTLRKRFYIFFVARDESGQLRKISIPVHYLYILVAGIGIGLLSLTGIASSYTRMLYKVSEFNRIRIRRVRQFVHEALDREDIHGRAE